MTPRLQHLQLARPHLSTRVASIKSVAPNQLAYGTRLLKTFVIYPSDRARVSRQSVAIFLFFFFLFFFFSYFYFGRLIGLLLLGFLNLLKVVNETRIGFSKI